MEGLLISNYNESDEKEVKGEQIGKDNEQV